MELGILLHRIKLLNFIQRFFACLALIQMSSLLIAILMRAFLEFRLPVISLALYGILLAFGILLMTIFLFLEGGKSGSYVVASICYFAMAILLYNLVASHEGIIFIILDVGQNILVTWSSANLVFSIILFIVTLVRLLILGLLKDYHRPNKVPRAREEYVDLVAEITKLKEEIEKAKILIRLEPKAGQPD